MVDRRMMERGWMLFVCLAVIFVTTTDGARTEQKAKKVFTLDSAKCEMINAVPPRDPLLEREHCAVCDQIVANSRRWNWAQHYESLCEGIPPHALSWVRRRKICIRTQSFSYA